MDLKKQHRAAIRLLKRLGLQTLQLERKGDRYCYLGWDNLKPGNGSMRLKLGKVKVS